MLDARARRLVGPALDAVARPLAAARIPALALTGLGLAAGAGACVAIAVQANRLALVLWLANRVLDGLDGPVARRLGPSELGGFLDIVSDFAVYAGFVVGVGVGYPDARLPCLALLLAYYVSGTAFLALSSLLERRGTDLAQVFSDGRSLRFVGGLAEGTETVIAYIVFCALPTHAAVIAWVFTVMVTITALQRVALGVHLLRPTPVRTQES